MGAAQCVRDVSKPNQANVPEEMPNSIGRLREQPIAWGAAAHKRAGREETMRKHRLIEIEDDFLEDGSKSVCSCGWKSRRCRDDQEAKKEYDAHRREEESTL
jgi:hypothetical protein